jgi:hypothetical protein
MAKDGHPVTPALVACLNPMIRECIRCFGRFVPDMADLPKPLDPQPLPFEIALRPLSTRIPNLPHSDRQDRADSDEHRDRADSQ